MILAAKTLWYVTRGTGMTSMLLLTAAMVVGIAHKRRAGQAQGSRFVVNDIHRNLSLLAVAFVGLHLAGAVSDRFTKIGWIDSVSPFGAAWRPFEVGLGTVAFDLMLAIVITSLLRDRMPIGAWLAVHLTAYLCWPVAIAHGLLIGSDAATVWMLGVTAACVLAVIGAVIWRFRPVERAHAMTGNVFARQHADEQAGSRR